ncbi:glycoside hydrolase family protein [Halomontanus rarus]|uniref:glycoside hydrolase family protein n=1 Tax=Halomontanus rarus TaxID=3034020 RepID=UPI0023E76CDA|nr:glycoside hydrolase family protein [Halovivax sp. TS33]
MASDEGESFAGRLKPAPTDGGFAMDDYWIWGSSVVPGENGEYHMFSSRWSKDVPFSPGWTTNSHIVRATSPTPEGPYEFAEVVVPPGEEGDWDRMSHNPSVVRVEEGGEVTYLLYYYGCAYDGPRPSPEGPYSAERTGCSVGLASAPSPTGPWEKHGIVIPDETNAVPVVREDGSAKVFVRDGNFEMSVYEADHWSAFDDYRLVEKNVLRPLEDHAVWWSGEDERYHAVVKDMAHHHASHDGYVDSYAGFHATSADGVEWTVSDPPEAYPHRTTGDRELVLAYDDGSERTFANLERAQVLVEDGVATHLYFAILEYREEELASVEHAADLPAHPPWPADTYSICVPLAERER